MARMDASIGSHATECASGLLRDQSATTTATSSIQPPTGAWRIVALGSLGFGVYQILWTVGLQTIPAGDSALLIAAFMRWLGHYGWGMVAAVAVGVPVATFLVFEKWFLVPLPKGPIEAYLGF